MTPLVRYKKKVCEQGKVASICRDCPRASTTQICEHGKRKSRCQPCGDKSLCEHGKNKGSCARCKKPRTTAP